MPDSISFVKNTKSTPKTMKFDGELPKTYKQVCTKEICPKFFLEWDSIVIKSTIKTGETLGFVTYL